MKKHLFTDADTASLCASLQYLLHAGISGADALRMAAEGEERPAYRAALESMSDAADDGAFLSDVFRDSRAFEPYVCELISAGEQTGRLEEAMAAIADAYEKQDTLDRRLKSALTYPAVLLVIMLAVVAVLLIYVLPVFSDVYAQLGSGLTGPAAFLLGVGSTLGAVRVPLLILFVLALVFLAVFSGVDTVRKAVLRALRRRGGRRSVAAKNDRARFALGLSMALAGGLGAEEAIELAQRLPDAGAGTQTACEEALRLLREGDSFAEALRKSGLLPAAECRVLDAGTRGGSGDRAIAQIAARLTRDSEEALEKSISRAEPVMVIISTVLVGLILLAVMLPLVNIMGVIG